MAKIIDGKAVSAAVRAGAKQEVEALNSKLRKIVRFL